MDTKTLCHPIHVHPGCIQEVVEIIRNLYNGGGAFLSARVRASSLRIICTMNGRQGAHKTQ